MRGIGERLRARARKLGLSDSEVARRLEVSQTRYANYVAESREPDFETLVRICRILGMTPNEVLAFQPSPPGLDEPAVRLRERIAVAAGIMDPATLEIAADIMDVLVTRQLSAIGSRRT